MKTGYVPSHPARLASVPSHKFGAVAPAPVLDRSNIDVQPNLYNNDNYGDCVCVSYTNFARGVAKLNGIDLFVDPAAPLTVFKNILGNPPVLNPDEGIQPVDALDWQDKNGFNIGPQILVARTGIVDINRTAMANAMDRFGGLWFAKMLNERDVDTSSTWTTTGNRGGVIGGHMMNAWDYTGLTDNDTVRVGTWARWQPVTWLWMEEALEAFGLVWRQLAVGTFYASVGVDGLIAEL